MRLATPISAFGPLLIGVGAAVLARTLLDLEALGELRTAVVGGPARMALIWVLPVVAGALVSCMRTLFIEITPASVRVTRLMGGLRNYDRSEVVAWGFEHGAGAHSTVPPIDPRQAVRFVLATSDGYSFQKMVDGKTAQLISSALLRQGYGR